MQSVKQYYNIPTQLEVLPMAIANRIIAMLTAVFTLFTSLLGISPDKIVKKADNFRVTTYIRGDYVQSPDSLCAEDFDIITHAILFECASFDTDGNVNVDVKKTETALSNIDRKSVV